jgi:alkanesulfonate monooxygenase SsuD/methylene tetrahydromethanopterin reductase-like flavin-dependent oxidoreductase (luciferase family)
MALQTSTIRIGTLVTSLFFRSPVLAARAAIAVDHLSAGRVEVALGAGDPTAGPAAAGVRPDSPADQVARFREFVELIDRLLRTDVTTMRVAISGAKEPRLSPAPSNAHAPPLPLPLTGR